MANQESWNYLQTFYSATHTQQFLNGCYDKFPDKSHLSFQNSYTFIYYLEHGKKYYNQALVAPYELQPVLLFYGMIQLMKATILTVDPNYPETTQVLAHGVSTRKRKRSQYEFLHDEVKVQKNGLLTHFSEKMFHVKHLEGEKFKMGDLMRKIPELHHLFYYINKEKIAYPMVKSSENNLSLSIDSHLLDKLNLTYEGFIHFLESYVSIDPEKCQEKNNQITIALNKPLNPINSVPIQWEANNQIFHIPTKRELFQGFPELLVHYLLLYNLSMICRYETDWWGELFHSFSSNDLPFITEFLEVTKYKVPYYISLILKKGQLI